MVRGLSGQMRAACSNVVSSAQGLPSTVQEQLTRARSSAEELYSSLGSSSSITPVLVERSRQQLTQVVRTTSWFVFLKTNYHNDPLVSQWLHLLKPYSQLQMDSLFH